jgi:hypothetical protein
MVPVAQGLTVARVKSSAAAGTSHYVVHVSRGIGAAPHTAARVEAKESCAELAPLARLEPRIAWHAAGSPTSEIATLMVTTMQAALSVRSTPYLAISRRREAFMGIRGRSWRAPPAADPLVDVSDLFQCRVIRIRLIATGRPIVLAQPLDGSV